MSSLRTRALCQSFAQGGPGIDIRRQDPNDFDKRVREVDRRRRIRKGKTVRVSEDVHRYKQFPGLERRTSARI